MGRIWSEGNKLAAWLKVEIATAEAQAEAGIIPAEAARAIATRARVDPKRVAELEARVKHDVVAFTMAVSETLPAMSVRWDIP